MAFRIERIELREIRLPLREPFRISSGMVSERRIALLELTDSDGTTTWSECVAGEHPNYSPETIDTAWLAITSWLRPLVLHRSFDHPRDLHDRLGLVVRGHEMARAAVEMGAWALVAERNRCPLAVLLGALRREVPVGISLGIQADPAALVERALAAHEAGYRRIKLKIAPGADVDFVAAVRAALPAAALSVDANNAYTLDDADHLARLDDFSLLMVEQPLDREDLVRHARLQQRLRTPICLDESITSVARAEDMIALGSGRIINIKPGRVGGFTASLAIHDLARAHGMPVWCGGMLESGIGRACNVALAALDNFTLPGDISPSERYWERDIVRPAWTMSADGYITVPRDPGLGVAVDVDYVDELTVRRETL